MNLFAIPPLISGILIALIGSFSLAGEKRNAVNILFSLCCLSLVTWLLSFSLMYLNDANPLVALRWARIGFLGVVFFPILSYHFTNIFVGRSPVSLTLVILYSLAFLATFLSQTDLIYRGVNNFFWGFYPAAGVLFLPVLIMFALLFAGSVVLLFLAWQKARRAGEGGAAQQILYVLIGFAGGAASLIDLTIVYHAGGYPFGYLSVLFFAGVIAYAILHNRLTAIESIIKQTAVYSLLTAVITAILAILVLLSQQSFNSLFGFSPLWASFVGAFIIALLFKPLNIGVQDFVDHLFFRARYDYQLTLNKYSRTLVQPAKDINRFVKLAPYLLMKALRLSGAACLIFDRPNSRYLVMGAIGDNIPTNRQTVPGASPLIMELTANKMEICREEAARRLKRQETPDDFIQTLYQTMIDLKAEVIIPCISESEYFKEPTLLAGLILGRKLSGEAFSRDDLDFLSALVNQAALSIEYTFMFEELKQR